MVLMGFMKYFFYLYGFIFFSSNLLVSVIWFLVACIAVVSWFSLSKGLLLSLLYLGGFMVLFIYMMSVDTKMKSSKILGVIYFCFLSMLYFGHFFHENFSFLLLLYMNKLFVFVLLGQLLFLLVFISEELLPIKSVRILY